MKKAFILSALLNIIIICSFVGKRIYYSYGFAKPQKNEIDWVALAKQKNQEGVERFTHFPVNSADVVFLGNSLTEGFPVNEYFDHAKNRGIGGNTIQDVINRVGQVTSGHPRKLFIEIGINDINLNKPVDSIKAQYKQLVELIRQQSPTTVIYIQSLLPTCKDYSKAIPLVQDLNKFLSELGPQLGASYINIYPAFLKKDKLNEAYTTDGLHLNYQGYEMWRESIMRYVIS